MSQMKLSGADSAVRLCGDELCMNCPTYRRSECFNTDEPIIDLSMCHALRMMESLQQQLLLVAKKSR